MLTSRGLGRVLGDLAEMGYDAEWGVLGASDASAPHYRYRIWIVAHASENGRVRSGLVRNINKTEGTRRNASIRCPYRNWSEVFQKDGPVFDGWLSEPETDGMADGVADIVDRLAATGNGQVPIVAATAFRCLSSFFEGHNPPNGGG